MTEVTEAPDGERLARFRAACAAHVACAVRIDGIVDDVELAVSIAIETDDEMEDAACGIRREHRFALVEARRAMDASLRRLNQRALRAGRFSLIEEQCAWSRSVLARVPDLMRAQELESARSARASAPRLCRFCGRPVGFGHITCGSCSDVP